MRNPAKQTAHRYERNPSANVPRSVFNFDHDHKTTLDPGWVVPVGTWEAYPGDTFNVRLHTFVRMLTPLVPSLSNITLETFFFAIPCRLLYDDWPRLHGEKKNPGDLGYENYQVPTITGPGGLGFASGSVYDYMGVPPGVPDLTISALPLRAYALTMDTWFRDQNLIDSWAPDTGPGPDQPGDYELKRRGKRFDYFTSALTQAQKGEEVGIPLGGTIPIIRDPALAPPSFTDGANTGNLQGQSGGNVTITGSTVGTLDWSEPALLGDLDSATTVTINALRQAFALQQVLEADSRGGTRYPEQIYTHFGVVSPDARQQRPEYLGGGRQMINMTPVPMTNVSEAGDAGTKQGDLAAYATSAGSDHSFVKSFTEHCIVLALVNIRAELGYQQGLHRMWDRRTRFDYYLPAFAHLGEQEIKNKEIYAQGSADPTADEATFGFQERWGELRSMPSLITGLFRSAHPSGLDIWHTAQHFSSLPVLNEEFIEEDPPLLRMVAVQDEPLFKFDGFFEFKAARPLPTYSVPGLRRL